MATITEADFLGAHDGNIVMLGRLGLPQDPVNSYNPATKHYTDINSPFGCGTTYNTDVLNFSTVDPTNVWSGIASVNDVSCIIGMIGNSVCINIGPAFAAAANTASRLITTGVFPIVQALPLYDVYGPVLLTVDGAQMPAYWRMEAGGVFSINTFGANITAGQMVEFNRFSIRYNIVTIP